MQSMIVLNTRKRYLSLLYSLQQGVTCASLPPGMRSNTQRACSLRHSSRPSAWGPGWGAGVVGPGWRGGGAGVEGLGFVAHA